MRTYCTEPRAADGERSIVGCRVFTARGEFKFVTRVEFDGDESRGVARVTLHVTDGCALVIDPKARAVASATFTAWVRVVERAEVETDPETRELVRRVDEIRARTGPATAELAALTFTPDQVARGQELIAEIARLYAERERLFPSHVAGLTRR